MVVGMFALLVAASYPVMALTVAGATMTGFVVGYASQQYRFHEQLCIPVINVCIDPAH